MPKKAKIKITPSAPVPYILEELSKQPINEDLAKFFEEFANLANEATIINVPFCDCPRCTAEREAAKLAREKQAEEKSFPI
jgi:hypothetical protein